MKLYNLNLANSVGVVDSGYRDTIKVRFRYVWQPKDLIAQTSKDETQYFIQVDPEKVYKKGDKIAQLIWASHNKLYMEFTETLPMSERGYEGFGSTGA